MEIDASSADGTKREEEKEEEADADEDEEEEEEEVCEDLLFDFFGLVVGLAPPFLFFLLL